MTAVRSKSSELFRLADVKTIEQLARALGVPPEIFREVIACEDPRRIYYMHSIPKRNPRNAEDYRIAWESREEPIARSHKAVARRLDDFARRREIGYPHPAVHGFVRGGSTRSNAMPHCGARVVVRADIENFFPTITLERVAEMLCSVGMKARPAQELARFVTINAALPLGLPESPVISNLVCLGLDRDLQTLADRHSVKYTRYADDMTFSGHANLPSREHIQAILVQHGFQLSVRKFKKSKRGQAHFVTGLSVSEKDYPHVPRRLKHRLRLELYYCEKFGLRRHSLEIGERAQKTFLRLDGMVKYVSFVERRKSDVLIKQWNRIQSKYSGPKQYEKNEGSEDRDRFVIVDETEFETSGARYLAICLVRIADLQEAEDAVEMLRDDYLTRPGAKGNLDQLQDVGVHYADAHFDLRTITLSFMADMLPWSASIHFARLDANDLYKEVYLRLFLNAIRQEFITSDESGLEILVERNDKIKKTPLTSVVESEYSRAEVENGRRPKSLPLVRVVEKASVRSLTLPDFVLAAFRNYAQFVPNESVLDFERIRDRVRYVHDADSDSYYTRKRPFVSIGGR
jgi:RNA-directed DNA polymerase